MPRAAPKALLSGMIRTSELKEEKSLKMKDAPLKDFVSI